MMICNECGFLCHEDDIGITKNYLGECHGVDCYEEVPKTCPHCHGEFVHALECKICGSYHKKDDKDFVGGYCNECLEHKATLEAAWDIGVDNKESVKLNGFITSVLTAEEIEDILYNFIKNTPEESEKAKDYCLDDKICFTDYLDEKCK